MQRLPPPLMEEEKHQDDYGPKVVSIGPNFHGKAELSLVQSYKKSAFDLLIPGGLEDRKACLRNSIAIKSEILNFYHKESAGDLSDELAEMMLLDASLIIIYMEITVQPPLTLKKELSEFINDLGKFTVAMLPRDLFLLRNQIPLCVIKVLINHRNEKLKVEEFLNSFLRTILLRESRRKEISLQSPASAPLHLLEALHRLIVSDGIPPPPSPNGNIHGSIRTKKVFVHSFRTATDLKAKGISFRPSPTNSLKDVSIRWFFFYARIQLPSWAVSTYTKVLLKNLVAYELSPNSPTKSEVTSYINLMKSLIDSAEDVKVLRERRILYNLLSRDEEAADVINGINTYGVDNPNLFGHVKEQIDAHCDIRVNTWIAELLHSYFRSPWTITAFIAANALLAITAAQLYYAVYPRQN